MKRGVQAGKNIESQTSGVAQPLRLYCQARLSSILADQVIQIE